jgi:hypothetical protein
MRLIAALCVVSVFLTLAGCSGSQGTGKNRDFDRPRAPTTKP